MILRYDERGTDQSDRKAEQQERFVTMTETNAHYRNRSDDEHDRIANAWTDLVAEPSK